MDYSRNRIRKANKHPNLIWLMRKEAKFSQSTKIHDTYPTTKKYSSESQPHHPFICLISNVEKEIL